MNAIWKPILSQQKKQHRNRRLLLLVVIFSVVGLVGYYSVPASPVPELTKTAVQLQDKQTDTKKPTELLNQEIASSDNLKRPVPDHILKRAILPGDNLSTIFDSVKISQTVMLQVVAADESLLALDILRPGNTLTFTLDEETRQLMKMVLFIHPAHQVAYQRVDNDSFEYEEIILPGTWESQLLDSEIEGSFYQSAIAVGLSRQETGNITYLFKNKLKFSRDLQAGDHFQVVRSLQILDGKLTGQSHIEAVRFFTRKHHYSAFLFEDGNFYDEKGESLARAFQRYPFKGRHRISSPFNPARLHPVTKRISPHKGVDFGMRVGTPIYSTGDGIVTRVKNHRYAGKYIEIKHDGRYLTRYMHLSRITVKRGQNVKRGERIALSGNTGRSTGPHLHYEIHIKGRAVDPISAKIPMAVSIPKSQFKLFQQRVTELVSLMEQPIFDLVGT
ncbi:MAG: peptidoglycan DD-metalloendopeptidase family protein [Thermodesulfobacteriota bacterium]|nr:peptidoglycan DD-metalloendopeptidase family protein [Thermodesulfobacteriota bacterium]